MTLLGVLLALDGSLGSGAGALFVGGGIATRPTLLTGSCKRVAEVCGMLLELG